MFRYIRDNSQDEAAVTECRELIELMRTPADAAALVHSVVVLPDSS